MSNTTAVLGPDGKVLCYINHLLLVRQQVSSAAQATLLLSHQLRHVLFEGAKSVLANEPDAEAKSLKLKLLAKLFDELENEQQKLWNFPVDASFHRFFDFPGCTCPKLDNAERVGTSHMIHDLSCPIHGDRAANPAAAL